MKNSSVDSERESHVRVAAGSFSIDISICVTVKININNEQHTSHSQDKKYRYLESYISSRSTNEDFKLVAGHTKSDKEGNTEICDKHII